MDMRVSLPQELIAANHGLINCHSFYTSTRAHVALQILLITVQCHHVYIAFQMEGPKLKTFE